MSGMERTCSEKSLLTGKDTRKRRVKMTMVEDFKIDRQVVITYALGMLSWPWCVGAENARLKI
jgi:hypothetical protein